MARDYYDILGVTRSASQDEIKRAYRKLAHQHHPDKSGGDEAKFKEVNEAYQVLGNPEKRQQYDQFGQAFSAGQGPTGFSWQDFQRQAGGGDPFGAGNPFGQADVDFDIGDIFGDMFGTGRAGRRSRQRAGANLEMDLAIPFTESVFGAQKPITLRKDAACPRCKGKRAEPGTAVNTCGTCKGSGQVSRVQRTILGSIRTAEPCPTCNGEGTVREKDCRECSGRGVTKQDVKLTLTIPPGIADGQLLRVPGHGAMSESGVPGDLFITVHVTSHPYIRREGMNLVSELPVSFPDAALGTTADVETIDGRQRVKVPAGIQSGQRLRIKGHGVLRTDQSRGDHFAEVRVETPKKLSRSEKKLYEELRNEM